MKPPPKLEEADVQTQKKHLNTLQGTHRKCSIYQEETCLKYVSWHGHPFFELFFVKKSPTVFTYADTASAFLLQKLIHILLLKLQAS